MYNAERESEVNNNNFCCDNETKDTLNISSNERDLRKIRTKTSKGKSYDEERDNTKRKRSNSHTAEREDEPVIKVNDDESKLHCICRQPDDGKIAARCQQCNIQFHGQCVGILNKELADEVDQYHCESCMANELTISYDLEKSLNSPYTDNTLYVAKENTNESDGNNDSYISNECRSDNMNSLDDENETSLLEAKIDDLNELLSKSKSITKTQCNEIIQLKNERKVHIRQIERQKGDLDELTQKIEANTKELKKKQKAHENASCQVTRLMNENRIQGKQIGVQEQEFAKLTNENKELKKENEVHIEFVTELTNSPPNSSVITAENTRNTDYEGDLRKMVDEMSKENEALMKQTQELQKTESQKIKDKISEIKNLKSQISVLEETTKDANTRYEQSYRQLQIHAAELDREKMLNTVLSKQIKECKYMSTKKSLLSTTSLNEEKCATSDEEEQMLILDEYHATDEDSSEMSFNDSSQRPKMKTQSADPEKTPVYDICDTAFLYGAKACLHQTCNKKHDLDFNKIYSGICFTEFDKPGSCRRGRKCHFTHEIPFNLRNDRMMLQHIESEKKRIHQRKGKLPRTHTTEYDKKEVSPSNHLKSRRQDKMKSQSMTKTNTHETQYKGNTPQKTKSKDKKANKECQSNQHVEVKISEETHGTIPYEKQAFLKLIRSMIQEQIESCLLPKKISFKPQ